MRKCSRSCVGTALRLVQYYASKHYVREIYRIVSLFNVDPLSKTMGNEELFKGCNLNVLYKYKINVRIRGLFGVMINSISVRARCAVRERTDIYIL